MVAHLVLTTLLLVVIAATFVIGILLALHRLYPDAPTRPHLGSLSIAIVVTILFSVFLSNLFAMKRDRENRLRSFRDRHYEQLRPVLRSESAKLKAIRDQIIKEARLSDGTKTSTISEAEVSALLWPEIMSPDLAQHFSKYDDSKRNLLKELETQDEEFLATVQSTEKQIRPLPDLVQYWKKVVAVSFVDQCAAHGEGIKLTLSPSGYTFNYLGGSVGASGGPPPPRPSPDQVAAARAFRSLKPSPGIISHCESLKSRAATISTGAAELSNQAFLLSEGTILTGDCNFTRSDRLED